MVQRQMTTDTLCPGDSVFHPKHGFGTVSSLTRLDPADPMQYRVSSKAEDYYEVRLAEGGTLFVPVSRAERAGLRRLTNGIEAVAVCLGSPAQGLPENSRQRVAVLQARGQTAEPTALVEAVRDLLVQCRGRSLSTGEKAWLDSSCEHLSTEVALVDGITIAQARSAVRQAVNRLNAGWSIHTERKEERYMEESMVDQVTKILTDFALTKFSAEVLEVKEPIKEGSSYRWRIISNRYKEVTVLVKTKKPLFGKPTLAGIEVYGVDNKREVKPDLKDLADFLSTSELVAVRWADR
jgi:RNA polymerase-interacting CarD/CdnL/TRCF family regulator